MIVYMSTVSSAIMLVSLTRIGCKVSDEYVDAVCVTRSSACACWLARRFSDRCVDIRLADGQFFFFYLTLFLLHDFV